MRILIVWEDARFETLGPFVKRRMSSRAPAPSATYPALLFHTSRGNGNFERYVRSTWRNVRAAGLPGNPGAIDHLVCMVDGDQLHELLSTIERPPPAASAVPTWHANAERAWEAHLRGLAVESVPVGTVHGRVLRWSKESLLLAGYDSDATKEHLGIDHRAETVRRHLVECAPSPPSVGSAEFTDTYRHPLACLQAMQRAAQRTSLVEKNAVEIDDALRALARDHLAAVCERVPDVDRLVDYLWPLVTGGLPIALTSPVLLPVPMQGATKQRRKRSGK